MKRKLLNSIAVVSASAMIFCAFSPAVIADDEVMSDEDVAVEETEEDIDIEVEEADEEIVAEDVITEDEDAEEVLAAISIDQAWVDARSGKLFKDDHTNNDYDGSGTYQLTENVTVTAGCILTGVDITIDLNGYTVSYTGSESLIKVGYVDKNNVGKIKTDTANQAQLTINDSSSAGSGKFVAGTGYTGGGSFTYSKGQYNGRGGCILVEQYSTLTMNGGTIDGFKAFGSLKNSEGGGIEINNNGKFYFNGGTVKNCSAPSGGGVSINKYCYFEMTGGSIIDNTASQRGGGLRINGDGDDIYIYGGTITGNNCTNTSSSDATLGGGGIYCYKCTPHIKGTLYVERNTCGDSEKDDIYLHECGPITLDGTLDTASKVAFFSSKTGATDVMVNTDGKTYDIDSFICNNNGYYPVVSGSYIKIDQSVKPEIEGYSLVIGGEILLKTYVDLGAFANTNTTATYSYQYTKNDVTTTMSDTIPFSDMELVNDGGDHDGEYTFCIPVVSAAMTAPIDVTVNYGTNGTVTEDKTVTVEEYADVIINEPGMDTDIVAAAKALKLYGYYSQVKFGINTNILPDITGYSVDQNISGASYAPAQDQDEAFAGATVSFLSETNVNLYFKKSVLGAAAPEMTVNYGGSPETITAVSSGSYYVYTVKGPSGTGFSATQYTSEFTYSVGNTSGTYSVATYLAAVVDKNANPEMVNLAQAYYNFAEKVSALQ